MNTIQQIIEKASALNGTIVLPEGMDTRVHAIRAFYAGEYVRAFRGVRALPVGKALLMRLFG